MSAEVCPIQGRRHEWELWLDVQFMASSHYMIERLAESLCCSHYAKIFLLICRRLVIAACILHNAMLGAHITKHSVKRRSRPSAKIILMQILARNYSDYRPRQKGIWQKQWLGRRGQQGLLVLPKELCGENFPELLNQVRMVRDDTSRGEASGLGRELQRERHCFTWSASRTLVWNFQYRLGWRRFFNKNLFILNKTSFVSTIFIQRLQPQLEVIKQYNETWYRIHNLLNLFLVSWFD